MGDKLATFVEAQLLMDLREYGIDTEGLTIDWSNACQEGHCIDVDSGWLESADDIHVLDRHGRIVAGGWIDFIYVGGETKLRAFWLYLHVAADDGWTVVKSHPTIPDHLWLALSEVEKDTVAAQDEAWSSDPKVMMDGSKGSGLVDE